MRAIRTEDQPRVDALMKIKKIIDSGYAGVLGNGNIVDRRENPLAIPIPKSSVFGNPDPKLIQ